MATNLQNSRCLRYWAKLWSVLMIGIILCPVVFSIQYIFAAKDDCDRHSLDAVYHERYKVVTEDIFTDSVEFVSRVLDLVLDSLTTVLANLPGRETSDQKEREYYMRYNGMKKRFIRSVNKMKTNITTAWIHLLSCNQDMLFDLAETDIFEVRNKTIIVADMYKYARSVLDLKMLEIISTVKSVVRGGLDGIKTAAKAKILKERKAEKTSSSKTAQEVKKNEDAVKDNQEEEISEEELLTGMKNLTRDIVPGFLSKVTLLVIERKMNLHRKIETSASERDSVLDDVYFELSLMRNKIVTSVADDLPKNKGNRDLMRRNVYMYWSSIADEMYKKKIQQNAAPSVSREEKYKKMWESENQVADTLTDLLEVYP